MEKLPGRGWKCHWEMEKECWEEVLGEASLLETGSLGKQKDTGHRELQEIISFHQGFHPSDGGLRQKTGRLLKPKM